MRKLWVVVLFSIVVGAGLTPVVSYAGEIDILLQKLVDKGILTAGEAQQVKTETQEQVKAEIAKGTHPTLPSWIQSMKLKGDFRLRYQYNHAKNTLNERHRGRFRLRLGTEAKVNEKLKVGFGLASGLDSTESSSQLSKDYARSTNQSFHEAFSKKGIGIDYAYAEYMPLSWLTFVGGKFKNPFWEPGDLIWDTDINPEGAAAMLKKRLFAEALPGLEGFAALAALPLDESGSSGRNDDPMMYAAQIGATNMFSDAVTLKGALSYYVFSNVKGLALDGSSGSNASSTGTTAGLLKNNYTPITPAFELGIKEPLKALNLPAFLNFPYLGFFGEYVFNPMKKRPGEDARQAWMLGFKFGAEKVAAFGDWQMGYNYCRLEQDAIPDILPDSDRYEGKTGIKGHELKLDYGLGKNTYVSLDIYRTELILPAHAPETLVQVDWNMKF